MASIPSDETLVEVTATVALTPEEGSFVSRALGRRVSVGELVESSGIPLEKARALVTSLLRKGVLIAVDRGAGRAHAEGVNPYRGVMFSAGDLQEAVDLTLEQKKRILFVEMNLEAWSHYALLGLKRTAAAGEIKQGYFKASKEFHPDAYFRKSLGRYKDRIDRVFRAMKGAYDALSNPTRRADYDANLVGDLTPEEMKDLERLADGKKKKVVDEARDERHEQRVREQRLKRNPMFERIKKGAEFMALAEAAVLEKRPADAERHARLAVEYAPHDEKLAARAREMIKTAMHDRARALVKRLSASNYAEEEEVARSVDQLATLADGDGALLVEAARWMIKLGRTQRAFKLVQQACEIDPNNADAWASFVELAVTDEKWNLAVRAAERLLTLRPNDARAKEHLKKARKKAK